MSFIERKVDVSFKLASGSFEESGTDTVKLSGLRVSARIVKAGGTAMSTAQLEIFGMTLSLMNQLSTLGMRIQLVPRNVVTVMAGDDEQGMSTVFIGTVTQAYGDFLQAPNVPFIVEAFTLGAESVIPQPSTSFKGSASAEDMLSQLAGKMGLTFENNGVSVKLANPYYSGAPRWQAQQIVNDAGICWNGGDNGKLAIWPRDGHRGGEIPLISPQTGMVSYPSFTANGISVRTLFKAGLVSFGSQIRVQSDLKAASKVWNVHGIDHNLDANYPGGDWFTTLRAYDPSFPNPVLKQ